MAGSHSNWEISLYEAHRTPHEMVTDESLIAVSPRALHAELMCPICLDLMRNTQTTKECLHRFCQECIITALRSGNKECPTCRKKLVSKRSLRPDPNFDALIAKIYPNREELLSQEKHHPIRPLIQNAAPKKKRKSDVNTSTGTGDTSPSSSRASTPQIGPPEKKIKTDSVCSDDSDNETIIPRHGPQPKIEFQLRPHPLDEDLSDYIIRNLCSTPKTTVAHLINFLHLIEKSNHQDTGSFDFVLSAIPLGCSTSNTTTYTVLPNSMNIKQITEQYWVPGEKLKLFYSLTNSDNK